jgi:hypothetical protein
VLASILLFIVGKSNYRKAPNVRFAKAETLNIRKFTNQVPALFFAITISFAGYVYCYGGVSNIVLPRTEMNGLEVNFLATAFLSVHVISTVILAKIFANRSVLRSVGQTFFVGGVLLWSISLLLLCINPFNSPRFYILGTWVPVVFGYFGSRIKYTYAYAAILLAVIVIMPVMSVTSRVGVSGLYDLSESTYFENAFLIKDMDVFDTLVHMVRMYESRTFDLGSNLLAIVLFFVPRSFWPEKPQVGGLNIGGDLLHNAFAGTDNLSLFIGGDFYMDFGWIGVAVGFYVLGVLWKTLQKTFYTNPFNRNVVSAVVTGSLPILLRGPVGAVVGYYVCLMTAAWLYNKILYRNKVWR